MDNLECVLVGPRRTGFLQILAVLSVSARWRGSGMLTTVKQNRGVRGGRAILRDVRQGVRPASAIAGPAARSKGGGGDAAIASPSDAAEQRINAALKGLDANLRKAIRDCKGQTAPPATGCGSRADNAGAPLPQLCHQAYDSAAAPTRRAGRCRSSTI